MKGYRGFSLLELLIVVAIILIIATIAIPSLLRSRQAANESAAVTNLRSINTAQVSYSASGGLYGTMAELVSAGLLDSRFSGSGISGYVFSMELSGNRFDYTARATATSTNMGRFDYYSVPDYVIRYSTTTSRAPAGFAGTPVR
ncbi:MAG TPA: prepilin-type N-terminal cleavage/methylation domain-containing protein [Terriglobia bacterium]|nr:prepilin-type N-terminal cleavage/methylation domain-containing protein [Terriglobia bacterium]